MLLSSGQNFCTAVSLSGVRSLPHGVLRATSASSEASSHGELQFVDDEDGLDIITGPFHSSSALFRKNYWGKRPLLWRKAFDADQLMTGEAAAWPTWETMMDLIYDLDDDAPRPSCRLIQHVPGQLDSFELHGDTADDNELPSIEELQHEQQNGRAWTILVNDVDHFLPALADWLDTTFGALVPRWRRDDAQVSCAGSGGGIGPHLDNYDVWLIQTVGQREWRLRGDGPLSVHDEDWIPDLDVAILQPPNGEDNDDVVVTLHPGDCLYVPPRWIHWGIAVAAECQTLSVGCRSPGAAALVARVAEAMVHREVSRYGGYNTERSAFPSLTTEHKDEMKQLVRDAVETILQDESQWDELVGTLATEPVRFLDIGVEPDDEDDAGLTDVMQQLGERGAIQRTAGISMATTRVNNDETGTAVNRFYAMGKMWELQKDDPQATDLLANIESGKVIGFAELSLLCTDSLAFVETLLGEGILEVLELDD